MTSLDTLPAAGPARDQVVVVDAGSDLAGLAGELRRWHPDWQVSECRTYLEGIAQVSRRGVRSVLACVDPTLRQLREAVAGLREAAGPRARLILCTPPEHEPLARQVMESGADDYVVLPAAQVDLDRALGIERVFGAEPAGGQTIAVEEIHLLSQVLKGASGPPGEILDRLAEVVLRGLGPRGVTVVVEGSTGHAGEAVARPVLTAPIARGSQVVGQLLLGERWAGAYGPEDVARLAAYAQLAGQVLQISSRQRRLEQWAITDECSGLPNRRYLFARLDEILERAARERFAVTVLLFDVDNFKWCNDRFGHDIGDAVIRHTSDLIREQCREQDVVARYGGDEFAVVFWDPQGARVPGSSPPKSAMEVLDRFREALARKAVPNLPASEECQLTVSGGLATFPWEGSSREELLRRADEALLAAKRAGKNRIFVVRGGAPCEAEGV